MPAGVFAVALILRLVILRQLHASGLWDYLRLDPLYYHDWAVRISKGEVLGSGTYEMTPLYAYALGGVFKLFGYGLMAPRLLQALLGAGTCALVALLGARAFGRVEGLVAGLALAAYGPALFHETQIMKTVLTVTLSTATAAVLYWSGGTRWRALLCGGILLGLTALAQENINVTIPFLLAWIAFRAPAGRRLACAGALLGGFALTVAPATLRNYTLSGDFVLITSGGGEVFYTGNNEHASGHYRPPAFVRPDPFFEHEDFRAEAARRLGRPPGAITRKESDAFWWAEGMRFITGHPAMYLALLWDKLSTYFTAYERPDNYSYYNFRVFLPLLRLPLVGFGWIAPLGLAGLALSARRWAELLPLHATMGCYLLSALLFFTQDRYRMPMVPLMTLFASHGAMELARAVRDSAWLRAGALGAAVAALALFAGRDPGNELAFEAQNHGILGEMYLHAGRAREAEDQFRRTLSLLEGHPTEPESGQRLRVIGSAHWGIVLARDANGEAIDDETLEHLRRAEVSPDPDLRRDLFARTLRLAETLHKAGRPREALAAVEEALRGSRTGGAGIDPVLLADAHYGAALILLRDLPDAPEASRHLNEVLRLNPAHPRADWIRQTLASLEGR
ncbi:MAG TPA: glycosyltransferase family 39 protein [Candidatus Polarisedimenticolia bacterium]